MTKIKSEILKHNKILRHIHEYATVQEVLDCLSKEFPNSYKYFYVQNKVDDKIR